MQDDVLVASKTANETVEITIDGKGRRSPKHTTGAALYTLGEVQANYELLEERQHGDDIPIANDPVPIEVHQGERFHSVPIDLNPGA